MIFKKSMFEWVQMFSLKWPFHLNTHRKRKEKGVSLNDICQWAFCDRIKFHFVFVSLQRTYFSERQRLTCDYSFRLFVGIRFKMFCNDTCQLKEFQQIEERTRELATVQFDFHLLSKKHSILTPIQYFIQNILLCNQVVFCRSQLRKMIRLCF